MKLPLRTVLRDRVPLPLVETEIRHRAARLDRWTPDQPFDRSQWLHPDVDRLSIEQPVRFLEGATPAGRAARRVCVA